MTTIKEYKEMMECATKGPWVVRPDKYDDWGVIKDKRGFIVANAKNPDIGYCDFDKFRRDGTDPYQNNANFIAASRNIAPELMRVIELAEAALIAVNDKSHFVPAKVQMALTEIKKLKGE